MDHILFPPHPLRRLKARYFEPTVYPELEVSDVYSRIKSNAARESTIGKFQPSLRHVDGKLLADTSQQLYRIFLSEDGNHINKMGCLVQQMAWWGLLEAFMELGNVTMERTDFLEQLDGSYYLCTVHLGDHLERWLVNVKGQAEVDRHMTCAVAQQYLNHLNLLYRENLHHFEKHFMESLLYVAVELLVYAIQITIHKIYPEWNDIVESNFNSHLDAYLLKDGWCPHHVRKLRKLGILEQIYCYLKGPPSYATSHAHCPETGLSCFANQADKEKETARHVQAGCACRLVYADVQEVRRIVNEDKIPILSFENTDRAPKRIRPVAECEALPYIAISHVWSQGTGNPGANACHQCQLDRIWQLAKGALTFLDRETSNEKKQEHQSAAASCHVWLDTLCVPLIPQSTRNTAISMMQQVFSKALAVLVIDSELLNQELPATPLDAAATIQCSAWASRLWTMQEAALATKILIPFQNDFWDLRAYYAGRSSPVFNIGEDLRQLKPFGLHAQDWPANFRVSPNDDHYYGAQIGVKGVDGRVKLGHEIFFLYPSWARKLHNVGFEICWRFTSRAQDESICIATMLGLDVSKLLAIPEDDCESRMIELFTMIGAVPEIILKHNAPRMQRQGWRWAPQSFLSTCNPHVMGIGGCSRSKESVRAGIVRPQGLLIRSEGYKFEVEALEKRGLYKLKSGEQINGVTAVVLERTDDFWNTCGTAGKILHPMFISLRLPKKSLAILVSYRGMEEETDILLVSYICQVEFMRLTMIDLGEYAGKYKQKMARTITSEMNIAEAEEEFELHKLPISTRWCIG